jgi:hypothetical protein
MFLMALTFLNINKPNTQPYWITSGTYKTDESTLACFLDGAWLTVMKQKGGMQILSIH